MLETHMNTRVHDLTAAEETLVEQLEQLDVCKCLEAEDSRAALDSLLSNKADELHNNPKYQPPAARRETKAREPQVGDRVRIVALVKKPELNNRIGTIIVDRCDRGDGRVAVAVDGLEGRGVRLKPENVSVDDAIVRVRDARQKTVLAEQVSKMDANASAGGRLGSIEAVLADCQRYRGMPVQTYGTSQEERERFWDDVHKMTGARPDFVSAGVMVSGNLTDSECAILREGGYDA